jgi:glycosyl transferase family 1
MHAVNITMIADELPFPPVHGGRLDVWRQLIVMAEAGLDVQLICWYHEKTESAQLEDVTREVRRVVADLVAIPLKNGLKAKCLTLVRLRRFPFYVAIRMLTNGEWASIPQRVRKFAPSLVLVESIYGGELARALADRLSLPLAVRTQNVEHKYIPRQAQLADHWRMRVRLHLTTLHLEQFELALLRRSRHFFDISIEDLQYWRDRGLTHGTWLPPFAATQSAGVSSEGEDYDLVFLGNLYTPSNVEAVMWLVSDIFPLVRNARPGATLLIAGRAPTAAVRRVCESGEAVTLQADPADAMQVYARGRVLVNPALHASGISMKSLEMLQVMRPVVSTPQGLQGLPADVKNLFRVARNGQDFAEAIVGCLRAPDLDQRERAAVLDRYFGQSAKSAFVSFLRRLASNDSREGET